MEYSSLSLKEIIDLLQSRKVTSQELVKYYFDRIKKYADKNAVLEIFEDALEIAKEKDEYAKTHSDLPILHGVPVLLKDNISYKGHKLTCSSKFMEDYVSPYNATVTQKLLDAGAVMIGRTNMDEFAMGGSTENSAFGVTKNALDDTRVSGGSSGGSACAMALGLAAITLGSDTGGSIRQPSSFNGTVGLKPTYGRVSRYGLVAFASSLDQIGPISKTVEDTAILMNIISGYDEMDQTSSKETVPDFTKNLKESIYGKVFGIPTEILNLIKQTKYESKYSQLFNFLHENGAKIKEVSIPHYEMSLPVYYVLAPAEASSNLGRFDGIKYTKRDEEAYKIDEIYNGSRTKFFGPEVKRRIMLGNFVLSSGYFDAYYTKSKKIKELLKTEVTAALSTVDAILMPTTFGEAFKIGEKSVDPVSMYAEDMFTIFSNLTEVPSLSVPFATGENGLPLGLQIMGKHFDEPSILGFASFIEKNFKENA